MPNYSLLLHGVSVYLNKTQIRFFVLPAALVSKKSRSNLLLPLSFAYLTKGHKLSRARVYTVPKNYRGRERPVFHSLPACVKYIFASLKVKLYIFRWFLHISG